jgi:aspartate-semialdehyde dehydrogenase
VVSVPSGLTLGWLRVLASLDAVAGVERVVATVVYPASHGGRRGVQSLSAETIALLSQTEPPGPDVFPGPVAFDCLPGALGADRAQEAAEEGGATALERRLRAELARLVDDAPGFAISAVQVPTFVGEGSSLAVELRSRISVDDAMAALEKAQGVELWAAGDGAPSTRDSAGREDALVGRVRRDPSRENGLLLWVATDGLRLAAAEVVGLAEMRLRLN